MLYLDLNSGKYTEESALIEQLDEHLHEWEKTYGLERPNLNLASRFVNIIRRACEQTGHRVVILVDEYDKPMLQALGNEELAHTFRLELKTFYSVLKSMDGYIRFAFLTGATKFSKISVFSDLNNLCDISMDERYVEICGLTEKEIGDNFAEGLILAYPLKKEPFFILAPHFFAQTLA